MSLEKFKSLMEETGVDANQIDRQGLSALHHAARTGRSEIAEYLVLLGANIDLVDNVGHTPLYIAIWCNKLETAKTLIRLGAKTDTVNMLGANLVDAAMPHVKLIRFVLDLGLDVNQYDKHGLTPLMRACRRNENIAFLLERGADYRKYSTPGGWSPLQLTIEYGSMGCVSDSLVHKHIAYREILKQLIEHVEIIEGEAGMLEYVDYNGNTEGQTALHLACIRRYYLAAKLLLHCGANPDIKDKSGKVPYDYVRPDEGDDIFDDYEKSNIRSVFDEMQ